MNIENIKNSKPVLFIQRLLEKIKKYNLQDKAASLTYYFLLSIGPFMMLLLYLAVRYLRTNPDFVARTLSQFIQEPKLIIEPILEYLYSMDGGSIALISILVILFSASRASRNLIDAIDEIFAINREEGMKNTISDIVFSYIFTGVFILSIVLFLASFVYGDPISILIEFLFGIDLASYRIWSVLSSIFPVVYLFLIIFILFKAVSIRKDSFKLSNKEISLASGITSLGWIIASLVYSVYINNFNTNNLIYGTLGNFMVLMVWFYLLIFILLIATVLVRLYKEDTDPDYLSTIK